MLASSPLRRRRGLRQTFHQVLYREVLPVLGSGSPDPADRGGNNNNDVSAERAAPHSRGTGRASALRTARTRKVPPLAAAPRVLRRDPPQAVPSSLQKAAAYEEQAILRPISSASAAPTLGDGAPFRIEGEVPLCAQAQQCAAVGQRSAAAAGLRAAQIRASVGSRPGTVDPGSRPGTVETWQSNPRGSESPFRSCCSWSPTPPLASP
ncbi:unnamed protein product, partial [Polarella glacialis]